MLAEIKPLLDWFHTHPQWAGMAMFFIAFAECLAVVGLIIPGTVIMTAVGTLIGAGILPFTSIMLWTIAGGITGDIVSYWFGRHYHQNIRKYWPFRRYPHLLKSGEMFFQRHGGKSIFIGRFAGPIRAVVPLMAGMMSMPIKRFLLVDTLSGIAWAPVYMLPGILIGYASQQLPPEIATRLILFIIVGLLAFWCISWLLKRLYSLFVFKSNRFLAKHWQTVQKSSFLKQLLSDPSSPQHHGQFILVILFLIFLFSFLILTYSVVHHGIFTHWNHPIYYFMRSLRNTLFDPFMLGMTMVRPLVLEGMWIAVLAWMLFIRKWWASLHWFLVGVVSAVGGELLKLFIHSPRPRGIFKIPPGWSFPSGHTLISVSLLGFLAVLLTYGRKDFWKKIAIALVAIIAGGIIFSRVYLGAHWLTDVIGATLLGLIIITVATISYRRRKTEPLPPTGILIIAILSIAIGWSYYFFNSYSQLTQDFTPIWKIKKISSKEWWDKAGENEPLYRTNRFGKSIQIINVQWAGNLPQIVNALRKQGWTILPKPSVLLVLHELSKNASGRHLPLLDQFYEDRKPVLVMFKFIDYPKKSVMLLRLWDAHLILDNNQSLWLGSINYHQSWHAKFLDHKPSPSENKIAAPLASELFVGDLKDFEWKKISYPRSVVLALAIDDKWDGNVLVIRPKPAKHQTDIRRN
jgi:membrane protein DedA with SNARE-associated domain/membrane-associated phospholipid phosphatase